MHLSNLTLHAVHQSKETFEKLNTLILRTMANLNTLEKFNTP